MQGDNDGGLSRKLERRAYLFIVVLIVGTLTFLGYGLYHAVKNLPKRDEMPLSRFGE
jgi:hypothetical protein